MKRMLVVAVGMAAGLFAAACGDDGGARRDAAIGSDGSAAIDAPPLAVDAAPLPVTFTITSSGSPVAGVTVYFQNADSSLVGEMTTDGSGNASELMAAGGFVTALVPNLPPPDAVTGAGTGTSEGNVTVYTYAGVKPGDHLVFHNDPAVDAQTVSFTAPGDGNNANYTLTTSCTLNSYLGLNGGSGTVAGLFSLPGACAAASMALWTTGSGGSAVAYAPNVPISASVNLTGLLGAYAAPSTSVALTYSDVPAAVTEIQTFQGPITTSGPLSSLEADSTISGTSATGTVYSTPVTAAETVTLTLPRFNSSIGEQQIVQAAATSSTYALDLGTTVLQEYTSDPVFTQATHSVAWTSSTTGATPDFIVSATYDTRAGASFSWAWYLAAPATGTTATYPVLPTDLFDYNAQAGDSLDVEKLDSVKIHGGYDAVRATVFTSEAPLSALGTAGVSVIEDVPDGVLSVHGRTAPFALPRTLAQRRAH